VGLFRSIETVPPGGRYFYEVPETKVYLEGYTYRGFLEKVRSHYVDNGLPAPGDIGQIVQEFMCAYLPAGFCEPGPNEGPRPKIYTIAEIKQITARGMQDTRRQLVSPGEALLRIDRCLACRNNDRSMCPTCVGLNSWAARLTGRRTTEWLGVCLADGMALVARVQFKDNTRTAGGAYDEKCWLDPEPVAAVQ